MVSLRKTRFIIQTPSGTDLSTIKPKLQKHSTLKPLKHQMDFGGRTYRYLVPNDGCEYFLYQRNQTHGIRACTVQERLENEEWIVRDVLDFGEKVISEKPDGRRKKELQEEISEFVVREEIPHKKELEEKDQKIVRDVFDLGEEEILHKKLKQGLQEKDQTIFVLTEQVKVKSQENETLQKILLQSLMQQVRRVRKEHLKKFQEEFGCKRKGQEEEFAQDMNSKFY